MLSVKGLSLGATLEWKEPCIERLHASRLLQQNARVMPERFRWVLLESQSDQSVWSHLRSWHRFKLQNFKWHETLCLFDPTIWICYGDVQRLSQDAKQAVLYRGRMESVDKWMSQRHLPIRLRNRIANFYAEVRTQNLPCLQYSPITPSSVRQLSTVHPEFGSRELTELITSKPICRHGHQAVFTDQIGA